MGVTILAVVIVLALAVGAGIVVGRHNGTKAGILTGFAVVALLVIGVIAVLAISLPM